METKDKVVELLKNNAEPMKAGEIAESLGVDKKEIDKAIKALKAEEAITSPKRCYYTCE
ncbi:MAG: helix-turn-helix domain-containing protein [Candidatus Niameybacter stercoravium]|nr:helix-turn-helix domain-containing protein [Candidatus Niameybacter stercoravium]